MKSKSLLTGGILSVIAALLHIAIIFGGAQWYRFFGAGEHMASMAEKGSLMPAVITAGIAVVLFIWGLYAFSGAGLIRRFPFMRICLALISIIYLVRGLVLIPACFIAPEQINTFAIWSSLICLGYGLLYAIGTKTVWRLI
ncbi:hypothetical protein WAE56_13680 [Iodobacter sp. LRB]|uniref:hypothetical protein n=1 Tax=unclassified Iodobacter TaxID=235634 RepID=UPI000C115C6A|nr:hypothetical protein CSQ88_22245 [Iodobacter sp. BJB302]